MCLFYSMMVTVLAELVISARKRIRVFSSNIATRDWVKQLGLGTAIFMDAPGLPEYDGHKNCRGILQQFSP